MLVFLLHQHQKYGFCVYILDTGRHSCFAPYLSEPVCLCVGVEGESLDVAFIQLCCVGASSALKGRKEGKERRKGRKNSGLVPLPY